MGTFFVMEIEVKEPTQLVCLRRPSIWILYRDRLSPKAKPPYGNIRPGYGGIKTCVKLSYPTAFDECQPDYAREYTNSELARWL